MKKWYFRRPEGGTINFEMPDGAVPLELGSNCPGCSTGTVCTIDLEYQSYVCTEPVHAVETIPALAFHTVRAETLDGWRPVYWREEDRNADPTA